MSTLRTQYARSMGRERVMNTLKQLLAHCNSVMDALRTLWKRRVVRLCARGNKANMKRDFKLKLHRQAYWYFITLFIVVCWWC